ncbi:MAG: DUF5076 domain-containing protein [Pseudomonadota bacterium]
MTVIEELSIPEGISGEDGGHELVRFWVCDGDDHVSLRIGLFDDDEEPAVWGNVAADIMKHVVNALVQTDPRRDPDVMFAEIERAFAQRLKETTDFSGQFSGETH